MALSDLIMSLAAPAAAQAPAPGPQDPNDLTDQFNTQLPPDQEAKFRQWQAANPRLGNTYDYDARGFWQAGAGQAANGHGSDKWKKPNHPTFSNQSQYSTPASTGGAWAQGQDGKWTFYPSPANFKYQDTSDLQNYWNSEEAPAGNKLSLPLLPPGAR